MCSYTCQNLKIDECLEKVGQGVKKKKKGGKKAKMTVHAVCESLWRKDGETEGARFRFDEVEVVYLACAPSRAGGEVEVQTGGS